MNQYNIKKTNIIRLFEYVKKQNQHVKKEKVNGKFRESKN